MERLIDDLDNNLVREEATIEVFSNIDTKNLTLKTATAGEVAPIPSPQIGQEPAPVVNNGGGSSEGATTMPVGEPIPLEQGSTGGGMGFPMGGGGGMPPAEEEIPTEGARMDDNKILGLDPKIFYGALILAGVGGYLYFRSRKK